MKLKKHREDVKWLSGWIDTDCDCDTCEQFRGIRKRYLNLIRMAEETIRYRGSAMPTRLEKRVLKDAK